MVAVERGGVRIEPAGDRIRVIDQLSPAAFELVLTGNGTPEPASGDEFGHPLDITIRVETTRISLSPVVHGLVQDGSGETVAQVDFDGSYTGGGEPAVVRLNAPLKTYVSTPRLEAVRGTTERTVIEFGEPTEVRIGVRSRAQQPAGTITVTDDPADALSAVDQFRSAMRTTAPSRSFTTLRGHPPAIETGAAFHVPESVRADPDPAVRLEVPPTHHAAYAAAPLAYYLSAGVTPSSRARIVTDRGFEYPIRGKLVVEIHRLLKRTLLLDCIVRTVDSYPKELAWHEELVEALPFDPAAVHEMDHAGRLERYLRVEHELVAPYVPEWHVHGRLPATADRAPVLPHLVDQLALVTPGSLPRVTGDEARRTALTSFVSGAGRRSHPDPERHHGADEAVMAATGTGETRSASPERSIFETETFVELPTTESRTELWAGPEIPLGGNHAQLAGYENRERHSRTGEDISVLLVCNDPSMAEEASAVEGIYRRREELPFSIDIRENVTTGRLRSLFAREVDHLHYIGHADGAGIRCPDGRFDATTLDRCGATTFSLNACESYRQGRHLVERGAVGGVVTLGEIDDGVAQAFGIITARLLDRGYPLRAAVGIGQRASLLGGAYLVVGDDSVTLAETDGIVPYSVHVRSRTPLEVSILTHPTRKWGMGTYVSTQLDEGYHLCSGEIGPFEPSEAAFEEFLSVHDAPVLYDGGLVWSDEFSLDATTG